MQHAIKIVFLIISEDCDVFAARFSRDILVVLMYVWYLYLVQM